MLILEWFKYAWEEVVSVQDGILVPFPYILDIHDLTNLFFFEETAEPLFVVSITTTETRKKIHSKKNKNLKQCRFLK